MDKIAQRRGLLDKIMEKSNIGTGRIMEQFSPEFTFLMNNLREVDDDIREHASDLKDVLKAARSNFNRREYMTTVALLGKFHESLETIVARLNHLISNTKNVHNEFLFGDLDKKHEESLLQSLPEKFKKQKKAQLEQEAVKEAGLSDWWHNINDDRGKALKSWEKRFPQRAKDLKRQTERMLNRSDVFFNLLISSLKDMSKSRNSRKLEDYLKKSESLLHKFKDYERAFGDYFNDTARPFIDSKLEMEAAKKLRDQESNVGSQTLPTSSTPSSTEVSGPSVTAPIENDLSSEAKEYKVTADASSDNGTTWIPFMTKIHALNEQQAIDHIIKVYEKKGLLLKNTEANEIGFRNSVTNKYIKQPPETESVRTQEMPAAPAVPSAKSKYHVEDDPNFKGNRPPESWSKYDNATPVKTKEPMGPLSMPAPPSSIGPETTPESSKLHSIPVDLINRVKTEAPPSTQVKPPTPTLHGLGPETFEEGSAPTLRSHKLPAAEEEPMPDTEPDVLNPNIPGPPRVPSEFKLTPMPPARRAEEFINQITKMAVTNNSLVLAAEILKFAKTIESEDAVTYNKLTTLAKAIIKR